MVFSYQKAARPEGTYAFLFEPVASIDAVDDRQVRFTLKGALRAPALGGIDLRGIGGAPAELRGRSRAVRRRTCVQRRLQGDEYSRGSHVTLAPNEHYWRKDDAGRQLPYLARIECATCPRAMPAYSG